MNTRLPELLPLERPLIIFDLETTGLTPGEDKVVEIAYEKILPSGEIIARAQRIHPGIAIPADAQAIHGIGDADVANEPSFAKLCYELWSMFEGADVGGFNVVGFDLPFLKGEFACLGKNFDYASKKILDAKVLYHSKEARDMMKPRTLSSAYQLYCGKVHTTAHSGAGDVRATVEILEKILEKYPEFRDWAYLKELHGNKKIVETVTSDHAPPARSSGTLF